MRNLSRIVWGAGRSDAANRFVNRLVNRLADDRMTACASAAGACLAARAVTIANQILIY
jgi:hypothetical protein